uniref:Uncharacterized protein n=1 Tax=Lactuca sativa TaxID=4236 RepID=A0A9R1W4N6_LACSA|nr:hypothetical protein LSAT_V11C300109910 [Lactuca sativa]
MFLFLILIIFLNGLNGIRKIFIIYCYFLISYAINCLQEINIDIESFANDSHLKLRVLKMWNFIKNNMVLSIEMIVMDEESRVFNQNFSRFGNLLKED